MGQVSAETGAPAPTTAAALIIGDEILSGGIRDANAHHLAGVLTELGVRLGEVRFVADQQPAIIDAVRALSERWDVVFTSGGIGPTHDDITADAVAAAFDAHLDVRADALRILQEHYGTTEINAARLRMARIPEGAALIDNPLSRAPGFRLKNVYVMAGVPEIFQAMLEGVRSEFAGGQPVRSWAFRASIPEGEIAQEVGALDAANAQVSIGVYPFHRGGLGCTIVLRSFDIAQLERVALQIRALLAGFSAEIVETPPPAL